MKIKDTLTIGALMSLVLFLPGIAETTQAQHKKSNGQSTEVQVKQERQNFNSRSRARMDRMNGRRLSKENSGLSLNKQDGGTTAPSSVSEDWALLYKEPQINIRFSDAQFDSESLGWAVGWDGTGQGIFSTSDGGKSWTKQYTSSDEFNSIHFLDADHGWALGQTIAKTTNGGETWEEQEFEIDNDDFSLRDIYFADSDNGWVAGTYYKMDGSGSGGIILETSDGGETWTEQYNGQNDELNSIHFVDSEMGWAVGYFENWDDGYSGGHILNTTDGGETWTQQHTSSNTINSVYFADANTGWVAGYSGTILKTLDGGETWEEQNVAPDEGISNIDDVQFADINNGWAFGQKSIEVEEHIYHDYIVVLKTSDGGETWDYKYIRGNNSNYQSLFYLDTDHGWLFDNNKILKTTDSGGSWEKHYQGMDSYFLSLHFTDENTGWAAGGETIKHTTDGGNTWEVQYSNAASYMESIHFVDENTGWAVGERDNGSDDYALVLHTTDGGETWTEQENDTDDYYGSGLGGVHFISETIGWAVGYYDTSYDSFGLILTTANGGETWETIEVNDDLKKIIFADEMTGWILGEHIVLNTTDGGNTWKDQLKEDDHYFEDIYLLDEQNAWVVSEEGAIFYTADGGETWIEQDTEFNDDYLSSDRYYLYGVGFKDANTGWASGEIYSDDDDVWSPLLLSTTDGGETWSQQATENYVIDMFFLNENTGWLGGIDLYKYQPGTGTGTELADDLPLTVGLDQNYPNPFNPSTVISYKVPVNSDVRLEIYDLLGRRVATLVDGQVGAGHHTATFDGTQFSSGMYIYRLTAGDYVEAKKMHLIK
ncbi:MAG: YCF48-related protein [Balneolales bacterium]